MLDFVARENIKRFEYQLSMATGEAEQRLLVRMLREENEKLKAIISGHSANCWPSAVGQSTAPRLARAT
jgi:hypothetical protein